MDAKPRLTKPQRALLDEITEKGGLYIRRDGRYFRTADALRRKGYVEITEHDYSSWGQDRYEAVPTLE